MLQPIQFEFALNLKAAKGTRHPNSPAISSGLPTGRSI
jgi:hypothetical protein